MSKTQETYGREILFRGKRKDDGKWAEGYYCFDRRDNLHFIFTDDIETGFEIDPKTLCQFVGRYDRTGKKIFEYDIQREEVSINDRLGLDERNYLVCVYIKEWARFAWLSYGEWIGYQSQGVKDLDESLQEAYGVFDYEDKRTIIKGNDFDSHDLLLGKDGSELTARDDMEFLEDESARDVGEGRDEFRDEDFDTDNKLHN